MANALVEECRSELPATEVPLERDSEMQHVAGSVLRRGRAQAGQYGAELEVPLERDSEMQHVAGSVLRRGRAQAGQYGAELVVIAIERDPSPSAVLEALPDPGYGFGYASTSDDAETIALALRAIANRLERG